MATALFLGRFQPFHRGHLEDVKRASGENDKVIIVIGSAQHSNTKENPFSAEERKEMIEITLKANNITNYEIIAVDDINSDDEYVGHVEKFIPKCQSVYTHNTLTKKLFGKRYRIVWVELFRNINSTDIRERIIKNKEWQDLVPGEVVSYFEEINGTERIRKINS